MIKAEGHEGAVRAGDHGQLPVVTTLMARGAFPDSHELCLGMPGMHGNYTAVTAMQQSDLLIALGARFDDRVTGKLDAFAPHAKIIHVDIDPAEIGKNRAVDVPIVGDCKRRDRQAGRRAREAPGRGERGPDRTPWLGAARTSGRSDYPYRYDQQADGPLKPQYCIERLLRGGRRATRSWSRASASTRCGRRSSGSSTSRGTWINSGGLGTMGFAVPAALGAARPGGPTSASSRSTATAASR